MQTNKALRLSLGSFLPAGSAESIIRRLSNLSRKPTEEERSKHDGAIVRQPLRRLKEFSLSRSQLGRSGLGKPHHGGESGYRQSPEHEEPGEKNEPLHGVERFSAAPVFEPDPWCSRTLVTITYPANPKPAANSAAETIVSKMARDNMGASPSKVVVSRDRD